MTLATFTDVSIAFGDNLLLDRANLKLEPGHRIGLIGRNGEGKTTLLKIIGSEIKPDDGTVRITPGTVVAALEQDQSGVTNGTVFEYVARGLGTTGELLTQFQLLSAIDNPVAGDLARLARIQDQLDSENGWNLQATVDRTLGRLGLDGSATISTLSGGWQRRASLARTLVSNPDILLLDEPTNHLDIESISWLEKQILKFNGAIVFVTHDREFLARVATDIVELDRGKLVMWPGSYQDYLTRKAAALHQEARQNAEFDKKLANEEAWIRQGIKARRTRNEGRVRALKKLRQDQAERRQQKGNVNLQVDQGQKSGKRVIEATNVSYDIAGETIISGFSTQIIRGDRIGLIGPNGIGKTTLLRLLLKQIEPGSGKIHHGTRLDTAYFDQLRSQLDPAKTVIDIIGEGREQITINGKSKHVISYLSDFLFTPQRSRSPVKALSGGERARVLLARLFSKPANLLVLDEPTNDLDIETLELLEELLLQFEGTLLLVSHDRKFLDNVVTSTLSFEGKGRVSEYVGGYTDWLRQAAPVTGKHVDSEKSGRKSPGASITAPTPPAKMVGGKKLSYKLQRELEQLPGEIEELEILQNQLNDKISAPGFYDQDAKTVRNVTTSLKQAEAALERCYLRWAELES
jgi:ATP-binding cassette subfamily F protein uup